MFAQSFFGIATGQTLQVVRKKYLAKGCFDVQKKRFWREINAFSPWFYHKWIKIMLIWGKSKFLLTIPHRVKCGALSNPNDYWLIATLSPFSKALEQVIHDQFVKYLNKHDVLFKYQETVPTNLKRLSMSSFKKQYKNHLLKYQS